MKTLFTITIKVTRPYAAPEDADIKKDLSEVFSESLREVVENEFAPLGITGLHVDVKVR